MSKGRVQTNLLGREVTLLKPRPGDDVFSDEQLLPQVRGERGSIANVYILNTLVLYDVVMNGTGLIVQRLLPKHFRLGDIATFNLESWSKDTPPCPVCNTAFEAGDQVVSIKQCGRMAYAHLGCSEKN